MERKDRKAESKSESRVLCCSLSRVRHQLLSATRDKGVMAVSQQAGKNTHLSSCFFLVLALEDVKT